MADDSNFDFVRLTIIAGAITTLHPPSISSFVNTRIKSDKFYYLYIQYIIERCFIAGRNL